MTGNGSSKLLAFDPEVRFERKLGGVVEVVATGDRFLTTERSARALRELLARWPGRFSERELEHEAAADGAVLALARRLLLAGDRTTGSKLEALYERIGRELPDLGFVFQNHGYAEDDERFDWVLPEDERHRYPLNLARYLVRDLVLDGRELLDVGCGRGGTCSFLARYFRPRRVVGVEYSRACAALCRRAHPLPGVSFVCGDAALLPLASESFDVVTNIESSHCYPAPALFYSEVWRVLRPGGAFRYTDVFGELAEPARVRRRLEAAGFVVELEDDITARVARGLRAGYPDFERALGAIAAARPETGELIGTMLDSIRRIPEEAYDGGRAVYVAWRLVKPGSAGRAPAGAVA